MVAIQGDLVGYLGLPIGMWLRNGVESGLIAIVFEVVPNLISAELSSITTNHCLRDAETHDYVPPNELLYFVGHD